MAAKRSPDDDLLERLHGLIIEQRLRHPGDPELDRHVANAVAKPTPRGWRLVESAENAQIDGLIAIAMAAERASQIVFAPKVLGWHSPSGARRILGRWTQPLQAL